MSAKSTRRRRDRRTRRSRTSRPSDASPRGDPHSPTAQHRLDAALATLQITPARRTATRGRRGSAGPSSTGGRSSRPPRPTSPSTCRSATRPAPRRRCHLSGLLDPTTDSLCRDVLRRIGREGRNRGRGQVAGVGWAQAEAVAARAADSGNLQGLRDAAIILVMSDTLARISEVVALQCSDVEPETTTSGGTVHIRASKTDQLGGRRYALHRAGHARRDQRLPGGVRTRRRPAGSSEPLGADGIRGIVRKRVAAVPGSTAGESAGTRSGWAARSARGRAAAGRAGGARLIRRRSTFASRPPAVRSRAAPLPGGPVATPSTGQVYLRSAAAKCRMYRSPLLRRRPRSTPSLWRRTSVTSSPSIRASRSSSLRARSWPTSTTGS